MDAFLIQTLNGVVNGLILALVASGLTLIFGIMDVVNFAHGELFMLGAYAGVIWLAVTGNFWVALLAAAVTIAVLSAALQVVALRPLLAERFKLKFHRETKGMPIFELVVGKNGPKFKESAGSLPEYDPAAVPAPRPATRQDKDGYPVPPPGVIAMISMNGAPRARFNAANESMQDFIGMISNTVGRPVVDGTGLKGKYDFILSWAPEPPPGAVAPASLAPDDAGPTFISAVQEQLGLKLDSKKGPVEILVIEHAEKPSEN